MTLSRPRKEDDVLRTFVRIAVRSLLVLAIAGVILPMVGAPSQERTPYASALSAIGFGSTYAAAYCNNKACVGGSRFNLSCGTIDTPYHCEKYGRNLCSQGPC